MDQVYESDRQLDVRGLQCPEPVLRARIELGSMHVGQCLEVLADDPLAEIDLRVFCERFGHELMVAGRPGDARRFLIRVGPTSARTD